MKYVLSKGELDTDIALPWKFVPEEAIELIGRDYIIRALYYSPKDGLDKQATVFLREVDSFKRGMKKFDVTENITIGI